MCGNLAVRVLLVHHPLIKLSYTPQPECAICFLLVSLHQASWFPIEEFPMHTLLVNSKESQDLEFQILDTRVSV